MSDFERSPGVAGDANAVPAMSGVRRERDNPLTRSVAGVVGLCVLLGMVLLCLGSLPYTLSRYDDQDRLASRLPPWWWHHDDGQLQRLLDASRAAAIQAEATRRDTDPAELIEQGYEPTEESIARAKPRYWLGTDVLGRSLLVRVLAGGGISLMIGIFAAGISVCIGTAYGAISGYLGGKADALMMRIVDVLYGLPYVLLVVLLVVAGESVLDELDTKSRSQSAWRLAEARKVLGNNGVGLPDAQVRQALESNELHDDEKTLGTLVDEPLDLVSQRVREERRLAQQGMSRAEIERKLGDRPPRFDELRGLVPRELSQSTRTVLDLGILLVAIAGVSWLTMARVVRGQVLSLKEQPFVEAARAMGVPVWRLFARHLLPNLVGVIVVYATLTVPQAILQESFLSFLGIGVDPPVPSWGNLAADGLGELNPYRTNWWMLLFPCLLLGVTLLALNFVGEGLREAFDPKRAR